MIITKIKDLRKEAADKHTIDLGNGIIGFKFHNVTKYYENDIVFVSHESKHINLIPLELVDRVEGVIVYFDSDNVSHCEIYECICLKYEREQLTEDIHFHIEISRRTFWQSCQSMQISSNVTTLNWAFCCAASCTTIHLMALHTKKAKSLATYWM